MTLAPSHAQKEAQAAAERFTASDVAVLKAHLQALVEVEFVTIPLYLTATYSFTQAAVNFSPDGGNTYPLHDAQLELLSVAVQEMLHLQLAANLCNSFGVTPQIPQLHIAPGEQITVPHLEPTPGVPMRTTIGNVPSVIDTLVAIEKPAAEVFVPVNAQVIYPSIANLYHATLVLLARYLQAYAEVPHEADPHFQPNHNQVNFGTFETTYPEIHTIATRADVLAAANAITDQGEGGLVASQAGGLYKSSDTGTVLPQFQPAKGTRFARWGALTHYNRFLDIQAVVTKIAGSGASDIAHGVNDPYLPNGKAMFYQADHVKSADLPSWATSHQPPVTAEVLATSASTIWSYLTDALQKGFANGSLHGTSGQTASSPSFSDAMLAFKYITPLLWQYGYVTGYEYQAGVSGDKAQAAMDAVDPLCLYHWDAHTGALRHQWQQNKVALNACQGLNQCKGMGWGGIATAAGNGACATADLHTCGGNNGCQAQGGCGYLSTTASGTLLSADQQWVPDANLGAKTGGCQTPINTEQVFDCTATNTIQQQSWSEADKAQLTKLVNTKVWDHARALFQARNGPPSGNLPQPLSTAVYDGLARRQAVTLTSKSCQPAPPK